MIGMASAKSPYSICGLRKFIVVVVAFFEVDKFTIKTESKLVNPLRQPLENAYSEESKDIKY